jgi:asparagine synthase (glutamine-hydrolysing)
MCGIFGAVGPFMDLSSRVGIATAMGHALNRRGPDNIDFIQIPGGFIGHTRLSLVDLSSAGNQPMISDEGNILSFNGEIYNFRELRSLCDGDFRSTSDTEVLLRLIEKYGFSNALEQCKGMFSLAYYCSDMQSLFLGRDRTGEKPLYYSSEGKSFIFSSDLKAIADSGLMNLQLCNKAVSHYFTNGFIGAPLSIYTGVKKLCPGEMIRVQFASGVVEKIDISEWFDLSKTFSEQPSKVDFSFDELVQEAHGLIIESVRLQSSADARLGSFLSGGVDSSIVTAIMAENLDDLDAFTLGSADERFNEASAARNFADHLGISHNVIYFEDINLVKHFDMLAEAFSEPLADSSQIPTSIISMEASKKVKGVLTGDGGDELFGGYYRYGAGLQAWRLLQKVGPNGPVSHIIRQFERIMPAKSLGFLSRFGIANARDKLRKISGLVSVTSLEEYYLFLVSNSLVWGSPYLKIPIGTQLSLRDLPDSKSDADTLCFWDQDNYLPGDNLAKIDRITMYHSIEARAPFLDNNLIKLMNSVEYKSKTERGQKSVLKEIQAKYYPETLLGTAKKGFSVPLDEMMRGDLREWCLEWLTYNAHDLLDMEVVHNLWETHQQGNNYAPDLWKIICFNRWYSYHFFSSK